MRAGVVGAGEVAVACALALRAGGSVEGAGRRDVTLFSRDPHTLSRTPSQRGSDEAPVPLFRAFANVQIPIPTEDFTMAPLPTHPPSNTDNGSAKEHTSLSSLDALFLCGPLASLVTPKTRDHNTPPVSAPSPSSRGPAVPTAVVAAQHFAMARPAHPHHADREGAPRFAAVFTRGLTEDGQTPVQSLAHGLREGDNACLPLLVASGPVFTKEWAAQCITPVPRAPLSASTTSSLRPRADRATLRAADVSTGLKRFSGTSLCFALWCSPAVTNTIAEDIRRHLITTSFPRENVTVLLGEHMAEILSLTNACALLCAFGGGLVSNAFAGSSLSALASYTQHAQRSVRAFVNGVLGRAEGAELPLEAYSTLAMACTNYSSREFVLGRKMDFHFRHEDALNAVYGGNASFDMAQTTDGIHVLLKTHQLHNPFLEALLDTFSTLLRASVVGEGLVKEGAYDFNRETSGLVLQHVMDVDDAMLSGNEQAFEEAKKRMQEALGPSCVF